MKFEWDNNKAKQNLIKHGIDFETATRVFLDEKRIEQLDTRFDYAEDRWKTIGMIAPTIIIVIYTNKNDLTRIISARKANEKERCEYYSLRA